MTFMRAVRIEIANAVIYFFSLITLEHYFLFASVLLLFPGHYPTTDLLRRLGLIKQCITTFTIRLGPQSSPSHKQLMQKILPSGDLKPSLGMCHGSHTLTRIRFSFAFYHTFISNLHTFDLRFPFHF